MKKEEHPFTTTIPLQSMHHSPRKTNAATAISECSLNQPLLANLPLPSAATAAVASQPAIWPLNSVFKQ